MARVGTFAHRIAAAALAFVVVSFAQRANAQLFAGENVNMVSGTEWPGGDPYLQRQNEPTIAVSTKNPRHLLAGANDYRSVDVPDPVFGAAIIGDGWLGLFKSFDAGQTWKSVLLPGYPQDCKAAEMAGKPPPSPLCGYPAAADPIMRAGTDGIFYYAGINFLRDKSESRVFVARFVDDANKENGDATANPPTDSIRYVGTTEVWSSVRHQQANPTAPKVFIDKPWIAVDVPRAGAGSCTFKDADGNLIPAGAVYIGWAQFHLAADLSETGLSDIMMSWSLDCGATWSTPMKLNTANSIRNQGVSIAVEPISGRVYVAWRRGAHPPKHDDAIMVARSAARKRNFAAPRAIAKVIPFDQGSGWGMARTQTMPSIAVSSNGTNSWAHLAWAARSATGGESKIYVSSAAIYPPPPGDQDTDDPEEQDAETRVAWSTPALADASTAWDDAGNAFTRGHQFMPSLTFGQGRLLLFYYDTRFDHTVRYYMPITPVDGKFYEEELGPVGDRASGVRDVFGPYINDADLLETRHTIDVRVTSLPWGNRAGTGSALVSKFPFGIRGDELNPNHETPAPEPAEVVPVRADGFTTAGSVSAEKLLVVDSQRTLHREQQLQLNIPGFPMFKGGHAAFIGDYVDLQGLAFVPTDAGWRFNTAPTSAPVFHAVWTSNQDVKTPWDGDWTSYTPVRTKIRDSVLYDGGRSGLEQGPVEECVPSHAGTRDQNIYTSRITEGLEVSSPQNMKLVSAESPTSFVIAARNSTGRLMRVTFDAPQVPDGVAYSWTNIFSADATKSPASLTADIAPFSAVHRTLFVKRVDTLNSAPTIHVTVRESAGCGGAGQQACRSGYVTLNPPIALASLVVPDGRVTSADDGEVYAAAVVNPSLSNPNPAPSLSNPSLSNPSLSNPSLSNPSLSNPSLSNPSLSNPSLSNPSLSNPSLSNPSLSNPSLSNPSLSNPSLSNPSLSNSPPTDLNYTISNEGNTTTSYHVKVVGDGTDLPQPLQLIVSKRYETQTAVGCELKSVPHDEVVVSVPNIVPAIVSPNATVDPGPTIPSLSNATVELAPGASATITLRGYVTPSRMAQIGTRLAPAPVAAAVVPVEGVTYQNWSTVTGAAPFIRTPTATTLTYTGGQYVATVTPGSPVPTGEVTFIRDGSTIIGRALLVGDRATLAVTPTGTVIAYYAGDETFSASLSAPLVGEGIVSVSISPDTSTTIPGGQVTFVATVTGTADTQVIWSVQETGGGSVTAGGIYVAPSGVGTFTVRGTLQANPAVYGTATVNVVPPSGALVISGGINGLPGTLITVSRAGYPLDGATVTVDGIVIPLMSSGSGTYWREEPIALSAGNSANLTVSDGTQTVTANAIVPAAPTVTRPMQGATVRVGDGVRVEWISEADPGFSGIIGKCGDAPCPGFTTWWEIVHGDARTATIYDLPAGETLNMTISAWNSVDFGAAYTPGSGVAVSAQAAPVTFFTSARWATVDPLATARASTAAAAIGERLYAIGGVTSGSALDTVEVFDQATGEWTSTGSLQQARWAHTAVAIDGYLFALGGTSGSGSYLASVERFDPETELWATEPGMTMLRTRFDAAAAVVGSSIFVSGGLTDGAGVSFAGIDEYVFIAGQAGWRQRVATNCTPRRGHAAVAFGDKLYLIGGYNLGPNYPDTAVTTLAPSEVYDPAADACSLINFPAVGFGVSAAAKDGHIYVFGGGSTIVRSHNPNDGSWTEWTERAPVPHHYGAAAVTESPTGNSIYLLGGYLNGNPIASVESFK